MNQAGADTRHLVGRDTRPHPAAADGHAAAHFAAGDGARQRNHEIRIVIVRLRPAVAEIGQAMTGSAQPPGQMSLQFKSSVVGGDSDPLRLRLLRRAGFRHRCFHCGPPGFRVPPVPKAEPLKARPQRS